MEVWKNVVGYENFYEISNEGRLRSVGRFVKCIKGKGTRFVKGAIKYPTLNAKDYLKTSLYKHGESKSIEIQRLVAKAFIPNPENKPCVNHIDGNKKNNRVENLEWVTSQENNIHKYNVLKKGIKPVMQFDLLGNYIATYESAKQAEDTTGIARCSISNVLCGRRNKAGGYVWKYQRIEDAKNKC